MQTIVLQIIENATNCQGASHVSNRALAQRARPNPQGKCGSFTKIEEKTRLARQQRDE